jgi:hypothetical protein
MSSRVFALSLSTLLCVSLATASTITVGTAGNAANWNLVAGTGAGTAMQAGALISISSDGTTGTPAIPGFNNSTWDGVWTGTLQFTLPVGATGTSLLVSNPVVDDRWVLRLNGTNIADFARGLAGAGLFNFGAGDTPFTFSGNSNFTINSGFNPGLNTLVLYVNNTGTGVIGAATRNLSIDATYAGFDGVVSFDVNAVPEPSTWCLSLGGLALVASWRRHRQRFN